LASLADLVHFSILDAHEETSTGTLVDGATLEVFATCVGVTGHGRLGISHEELGFGWHLKVYNILL
jgi:hypothetical protein